MRMRRALATALCGALLLLTGTGIDPFQNLYRDNRAGVKALEEDRADEAVEAFSDAQALAPDDPRVLYNLGLALARKGKLTEADQAWKRASELAEGKLRRDAWFNRGVAALSGKDPARAARAFGESLLVDPQDEEARRNLEFALRRLQQNQQKNQQNRPDDSQEKKNSKQQGEPSSSQRGDSGKQQQEPRPSQQQGEKSEDRSHSQRGTSEEQTRKREESPSPTEEEKQNQQQKQRDQAAESRPQEPSQGGDEKQSANRQEGSPESKAESPAQSSDQQMAARLLKMLEQNETQALRRALQRRGNSPRHPREKSW